MNARRKRSERNRDCPVRRSLQVLSTMDDREAELAAGLLEAFAGICQRGNAMEQRTMVKAFVSLCGKIDELDLMNVESDTPRLKISRPV